MGPKNKTWRVDSCTHTVFLHIYPNIDYSIEKLHLNVFLGLLRHAVPTTFPLSTFRDYLDPGDL